MLDSDGTNNSSDFSADSTVDSADSRHFSAEGIANSAHTIERVSNGLVRDGGEGVEKQDSRYHGVRHRYRLARFHRLKVRIVATVLGMIALFVIVYLLLCIIRGEHLAKIGVGGFDFEKNAFLNFFYKSQDASGKEIVITSKKVIEDNKDSYIFENVKSDFSLSNKETGTITADKGRIIRKRSSEDGTESINKGSISSISSDNDVKNKNEEDDIKSQDNHNHEIKSDSQSDSNNNNGICKFKDNVVMVTKSGLSLNTDEATFDSQSKIIYSESPISIIKNEAKITAEGYRFDTDKNILELKRNAKAVVKDREIFSNQMTIFIDNGKSESLKKVIAKGNVRFKSAGYELYTPDSLIYENNQLRAEHSVELKYRKGSGIFTITSYRMVALLEKTKSDSSEIYEILADGNVQIKTKDSVVKSDHAIYKKNFGKVEAYGNVIISREIGDIFGEKAELDLNTGMISINKSSGVVRDNWVRKRERQKI